MLSRVFPLAQQQASRSALTFHVTRQPRQHSPKRFRRSATMAVASSSDKLTFYDSGGLADLRMYCGRMCSYNMHACTTNLAPDHATMVNLSATLTTNRLVLTIPATACAESGCPYAHRWALLAAQSALLFFHQHAAHACCIDGFVPFVRSLSMCYWAGVQSVADASGEKAVF